MLFSVFYSFAKTNPMTSRSIIDLLPNLKGMTALVVEDNPLNAMVVQKLLKKWGLFSELAINGKIAIEKANQKPYDFILMDLQLPFINGFDATVHIRSHDNPNKKTPIYALTMEISDLQKKQYALIFNGFFQKPLQIETLCEALLGVSVAG